MNPVQQRRLMAQAMRDNFWVFLHRVFLAVSGADVYRPNWHHEAMAWKLSQVASGEVTRLLMTLPPRQLKSITVSVAFAAWMLGRDPTMKIIGLSYTADLALKHSRDCRRIMESAWYREVFPYARLSREKNAEGEFETTLGGGRYATSFGGTLTGRGGQLIIVDDPMNPEMALSDIQRKRTRDWFDGTVYSRLNDKAVDAIIVIMQRLHLDDLAGHLLSKEEYWDHLNIPAISDREQVYRTGPKTVYTREADEVLHPERESREVLERLRSELGSYAFSAQYLQQPVPIDGELIKWGWFDLYEQAPERVPGLKVVQSWDTALTDNPRSCFSVCTTWLIVDDQYYLLDLLRERMRYPDLKRAVIEQAHHWNANYVLIENCSTGAPLIQELEGTRAMGEHYIEVYEPMYNKTTRLHAQSAVIESGRVHLPGDAQWLETLRAEIVQFPNGCFDDQVDSITQFLDWAEERRLSTDGMIGSLDMRTGKIRWKKMW